MRTPPLLSPVENENSDLLIIHILGERRWEGLSPFTALTIGKGTLLTYVDADCVEASRLAVSLRWNSIARV